MRMPTLLLFSFWPLASAAMIPPRTLNVCRQSRTTMAASPGCKLDVPGRRSLLAAALVAASSAGLKAPSAQAKEEPWGPLATLSVDEVDALDMASRNPEAGFLLPSGVRVIDMVVGSGPMPAAGTRVYCHYKVWGKGFRSGAVSDFTFADGRPYDWILGEPTDRIPRGADEGTSGMREGGWRRLVVPAAYGDRGLLRINRGPFGARYTGAKASFSIKPNETAYFDLIMVDGGSGRCDKLLRPPGVDSEEAAKLSSMMCVS
mmetsp:Transcript_20267/g.39399  ORF Transcript_20267/g.39399 Transcript_20267/m.39399 type:complete len:260 (+) Transcript_20267:154-933(+)